MPLGRPGHRAAQLFRLIIHLRVNNTHKLRFVRTGGDLHAYEVIGGCGFLAGVNNGDSFALTGTGTVTPAQAITSP